MRRLALALVFLAACATAPKPQINLVVTAPIPSDVGVATGLAHTLHMLEGCTAVSVGGGFVITAHHCVVKFQAAEDTSVGVTMVNGWSNDVDVSRDWALLFNYQLQGEPKVCLRAPRLGERIYSVGYPSQRLDSNQALTVGEGVVAAKRTVSANGYSGLIRHSATTHYGSSGGGFWAADGCLVGITHGGFPDTDEKYMTPATDFISDVSYMVDSL